MKNRYFIGPLPTPVHRITGGTFGTPFTYSPSTFSPIPLMVTGDCIFFILTSFSPHRTAVLNSGGCETGLL